MAQIRLQLPLTREALAPLRAGDEVLISGDLYTARDAAHKRLVQCLQDGQPLPFDVRGQLIYYVGPAPASPALLDAGLLGMMGKGKRSPAVIESMVRHGAVYFGAVGGAAALISRHITHSEVVAYPDLGAEAVHCFTVVDFPALVIIDSLGQNLYEIGPRQYCEE